MPHRTQTPAYHRWWWLQANRHVSGEILKLAARLGLDSTAADEWAAGVLAASGSKSPGQVLRSAWLAVMAEQLASPGAATAKSPLTLGEIRGLASGALPAKAGKPTGQVPSNALPSTAGLPSAQDPAVVAWVPRARSLIGGSNIPKAIVETLASEILKDPKLNPDRHTSILYRLGAANLATAAFKQANLQYVADVKKVSAAAKALEEILNQPGAQEREVRAAADILLAALRADNATSLPTDMTRVALRFAMDRRLNPHMQIRFSDHAQGHGFQTDVSTASGRTGLTYPQALVRNPQETDAITAGLMARLGLGKETIRISVFEVEPPGVTKAATLNQQPGIVTRVDISANEEIAGGDEHAAAVLYRMGGNSSTRLRLRFANMGEAKWRQAIDEFQAAHPGAGMSETSKHMFNHQRKTYFGHSLNSLAEFSNVVNISGRYLDPHDRRVMSEWIVKNPDKTFVFSAGNSGLMLGTLVGEGARIDGKIRRAIGNTEAYGEFENAANAYMDQRIQAELANQNPPDANSSFSSERLQKRVVEETIGALDAYTLSLLARHKNVIIVGAGDLSRGVASVSNRDPFLVDISAPGDYLYPSGGPLASSAQISGDATSLSAPLVAKAIAYAQRMSMVSPTDPGLLPEELIELGVRTADKDPRFVGANRAGGTLNPDRFSQTAALVGQLRKVLTAVPPNESAAQKSARELADTELVQSTGKRLGIKPDRLAEIAPLAVDMTRRVNARLAAPSRP